MDHSQVGCGDTSGAEEAGPSCFLLDSSGVVLMDRRLLALDAQVASLYIFRAKVESLSLHRLRASPA